MKVHEQIKINRSREGISNNELAEIVRSSVVKTDNSRKKVLLIPPDGTRMHSAAGIITNLYYHHLREWCDVKILPALGTHVAMSEQELSAMFGDIPPDRFLAHNWRTGIEKIGEVPASYVSEISEGLLNQSIPVEINRELLDRSYDLILSVGQVVPHEVVGMANYSKNILVGCGGSSMINASHILGAFYGLERIMGKDHSPVRKLFDYAQNLFLSELPVNYVLTVTTAKEDQIAVHGLFIGRARSNFEQAVKLSQEKNLIFVDEPISTVLVYLDPEEFKSTWLGNKAIYRTRMALADGGELIVLAPGVERFGEDEEIDRLIRKYGYSGRERIIEKSRLNDDLQKNLSAAAHLIHGSSDGRFRIRYCTGKLSRAEVESVGFEYSDFLATAEYYGLNNLKEGYNKMPNGKKVYFISNPALGLWTDRSKFPL